MDREVRSRTRGEQAWDVETGGGKFSLPETRITRVNFAVRFLDMVVGHSTLPISIPAPGTLLFRRTNDSTRAPGHSRSARLTRSRRGNAFESMKTD